MSYWLRLAVCLAAPVLLTVGCTGSSGPKPSPTSAPSTSQGSSSSSSSSCVTSPSADATAAPPILHGAPRDAVLPKVSGRCSAEVDLHAPGINISDTASFGLNGGGRIEISASNWNTIGPTSSVPADATVIVDSTIQQTQTSQRRFQYLADLIELFHQPTFCPSGFFAVRKPGTYVEIGVIRNSGFKPLQLRSLHVYLTESPPRRTVGDHVLFGSAAMTLPANSMYFFEVIFPANGKPDPSPKTDTFSFHWDSLKPGNTPDCT